MAPTLFCVATVPDMRKSATDLSLTAGPIHFFFLPHTQMRARTHGHTHADPSHDALGDAGKRLEGSDTWR